MRLLFDRKADVHLQVNTTALLKDHKDELAIYFALDSQEPDSYGIFEADINFDVWKSRKNPITIYLSVFDFYISTRKIRKNVIIP